MPREKHRSSELGGGRKFFAVSHDPYASLRVPNYRWFIVSLLTMTVSSQIQGVVVDEAGKPVAGTYVEFHLANGGNDAGWYVPATRNEPNSWKFRCGPVVFG